MSTEPRSTLKALAAMERWLADPRLSLTAKGALAIIATRNGCTARDLRAVTPAGLPVSGALAELRAAGAVIEVEGYDDAGHEAPVRFEVAR